MADVHDFTPSRARPSHAAPEIELAREAIRSGVQYLAFRPHPFGLNASYAPGPGRVNGYVARAAYAALEAHKDLAPDIQAGAPSPVRARATATRLRFAEQLAQVKSGFVRAPTQALRSDYLDALADFMLETVHEVGLSALAAWAAPHEPEPD